MNLTPEEKEDIKSLLLFLVEKKSEISDGHNGFHLKELEPFLQELVEEQKIKCRPTITADNYFKINN
ncbi:hypothetical protein [Christiangramia forsetii]|uniref:Uncharacterized protein n=2 Tax=Christiangramia forsetii TaxID=411153 RepID=A0M492_CHRFK|nr:hypothetical protein [Christiangramia forsetii]GGG23944.1 hypothetical protein GCM10011532_03970 [Christiangramia forsetii]CAL67437.1 hypothetical protein GFO_2481 [Christiangramia forsetii KT0803]